ncbi:hypothetical protein QWY93_09380 [Echinicola jeungdonensis]|uniref:CASTOR/POLLUX/SYM8 ion channel conserved domain-containing protein n=1 Tax=Echinicola jeungdonensis TaxID=709343 RepID=A0ABV5J4Z1_9BACT|nr:hypothetical protein [Echinicola jeungdonensis]MDN3669543.1 hypothetical protein [Echinicola jeungdonensis]
MRRKKLRILESFNFFLERQFIRGAHVQLFFVALLIGLLSVIGGALVLPSGEPTDSLGEAIWWAFLRLSDPGYLGDDEGTWRRLISTLITVAGYVVFLGSLVAIITTWLNRKIRILEQGLTPVTATNHIVILGWTNRTIHIAAELFQSTGRLKKFLQRHGVRKLKLIILSDDVTPDRLQELKDHPLIGERANEVILRSGDPIDREHLRRVDSLNASAIIIPSQTYTQSELITPDVETIKTLLSLNAEANGNFNHDLPYVVAEIQDENKLKAAYRAYSGPLEVISSDNIISRLIAQNVRHYGLSEVYNELLSNNFNNNLYARDFPEIIGKEMGFIKSHYDAAIVLGVVRKTNQKFEPFLNPPDDFEVKGEDRLILLARKMEDTEFEIEAPETFQESDVSIEYKGSLPIEEDSGIKQLLILGWNHQIPALIKELGSYEDEAYHVTIVSLRPPEERQKEIDLHGVQRGRLACEHLQVDYIRESELRGIHPEKFDNIILVSSGRLTDEEEADARTIVGYTLLEEILEGREKKPHILLELSDPSNEILIKNFKSEVLIGPLILSNLLASIAMRRELHSVHKELFTVGGAEIIFRTPQEYGLEAANILFSDLEKRAAEYHETALGIYEGFHYEKNKVHLKLNPDREEKLAIHSEVRLVVLTTVY